MADFLPEGNTPLPTDSPKRSLHKIVDLLGGGSGGGSGVVALTGENYRFSGTGAATQLQMKNPEDAVFHRFDVKGTGDVNEPAGFEIDPGAA